MKTLWLTDIHLDFFDDETVYKYFATLARHEHDAILITGDISISQHLMKHLSIIDSISSRPVYFVCGNHDFYGSSFDQLSEDVSNFCRNSKNLVYLTRSEPVTLGSTILIGVDSWYDCRASDPFESRIVMSDWRKIDDYRRRNCITDHAMNLSSIIAISQKRADNQCDILHDKLSQIDSDKNVIIATHIPLFPGGEKHESINCWYTNIKMGYMIQEYARDFPERKFITFSGHRHKKQIIAMDNLICNVGDAEYSVHSIAGIITT